MELAWIKDLAEQELNSENSEMREISMPTTEASIIEEGIINFLMDLKDEFKKSTDFFNTYRPNASIKMYRINNTVADFMLFRNGLKLVVANSAPGIISLYFMSPMGGVFGAGPSSQSGPIQGGHQLRAKLGPFGEVGFFYQELKVEIPSMVKHYLGQFIKMSSN